MTKPPPQRRPGDDEDICPVCKSSRYLNPNMRFLVNPECYHKMCESCVDRIFSHGPAPCPVAGCHRTLRKQRFRTQTFGDIQVEREVDVRKRLARVFNRRQSEFTTLLDYNNYLEEVETLTFNLLHGIDVSASEAKVAAYAAQNAAVIDLNSTLQRQEHASVEARAAAEREETRLRREAARHEEEAERLERAEGRRELIERLAQSESEAGAAERIAREGQRVMLKRSSARRAAAAAAAATAAASSSSTPSATTAPPPPPHQHRHQQEAASGEFPANSSSTPQAFVIKGLKKTVAAAPEPERAYDAFGGLSDEREYFVPQDRYEHPWLDRARTDPAIVAGGYDVREYCTRALVEAFAGLGVFVAGEEEGAAAVGAGAGAGAGAGGSEGDVQVEDGF